MVYAICVVGIFRVSRECPKCYELEICVQCNSISEGTYIWKQEHIIFEKYSYRPTAFGFIVPRLISLYCSMRYGNYQIKCTTYYSAKWTSFSSHTFSIQLAALFCLMRLGMVLLIKIIILCWHDTGWSLRVISSPKCTKPYFLCKMFLWISNIHNPGLTKIQNKLFMYLETNIRCVTVKISPLMMLGTV